MLLPLLMHFVNLIRVVTGSSSRLEYRTLQQLGCSLNTSSSNFQMKRFYTYILIFNFSSASLKNNFCLLGFAANFGGKRHSSMAWQKLSSRPDSRRSEVQIQSIPTSGRVQLILIPTLSFIIPFLSPFLKDCIDPRTEYFVVALPLWAFLFFPLPSLGAF